MLSKENKNYAKRPKSERLGKVDTWVVQNILSMRPNNSKTSGDFSDFLTCQVGFQIFTILSICSTNSCFSSFMIPNLFQNKLAALVSSHSCYSNTWTVTIHDILKDSEFSSLFFRLRVILHSPSPPSNRVKVCYQRISDKSLH